MKNLKHVVFSGFVLLILFGSEAIHGAYTPLKETTNQCEADIALFNTQIDLLAKSPSVAQFLQTRKAYKRIEFLVSYTDQGALKNLNGPNLVKPDPNPLSTDQNDPSGLQAIEAIIAEEEIDTAAVQLLCQRMTADMNAFTSSYPTNKLSDAKLFVALRSDLLTVAYKGVVGFDTPLCKAGIDEAVVSIDLQIEIVNRYADFGNKYCASAYKSLLEKLNETKAFLLAHPDFDSFDRFTFLKTCIHPAYAAWYEFHKASGLEMSNGPNSFTNAVNYNAVQPFSDQFFNPWFYSRFKYDKPVEASIALGRTLFFDPILSADGQQSCATCHRPELAFTDGKKTSIPSDNNQLQRNAPSLIQAALQNILFYDGRAHYLEDQLDHVVFNDKEFNTDFETIAAKLSQSAEYIQLFRAAYPNQPQNAIDGFTISKALADYVRSLKGFNSAFDKQMRGEAPEDSLVTAGFNLFMGKALCGTCHFAPSFNGNVPPQFIDTEMEVLGVPINKTNEAVIDPDLGRYNIQRSPVNQYAFKTPNIRNVALTAPYMHNGAYANLSEVLDFYKRGGGVGLGQDLPHQTLPFDSLVLDKKDLLALEHFMLALTDTIGSTQRPARLPDFPDMKNRSQVKY